MNIPEIIKQFDIATTIEDIIYLAGVILLSNWLLKTSLGRKALADSPPRSNDMPLYTPFIPLFIWMGGISIALSITKKMLPALTGWQNALRDNSVLCLAGIMAMGVIISLARYHFTQRLKGFGLDIRTIHRDFFTAVINLITVWPLVLLAFVLTLFFGQFIYGPNFQMQQHEELKSIAEYPQLSLRILIIVTAVLIVPAFEEMLFRGMFQTAIRSHLARPWLAILASSLFFAVTHANAGHWPALFVLSICMGYSYEKSGSLFRPIFIHSLFNTASIAATLYSV